MEETPLKRDLKSPITGITALAVTGAAFLFHGQARHVIFLIGSAGFVGWGTNALAIRMIFDRFRILGIPIPFTGVIPNKRNQLIAAISSSVARKLVQPGAMRAQILKSDFLPALVAIARDHLQTLASDDAVMGRILEEVSARGREAIKSPKLRETIRRRVTDGIQNKGFLARALVDPELIGNAIVDAAHEFLGGLPSDPDARMHFRDLASKLPAAGTDSAKVMEDRLRPVAEGMLETALARIDIEAIVKANLDAYSDQQIKELVLRATSEHLGWLEVWGGVLGAVAGLVMWLVMK